ncbi:hypothetical protein MBLNU459_g3985t1 [Dothideomycetes sp. NU459]
MTAQPTLASAVVLPQTSSPSPPPQAGTKRRQSDAPIESPKRQRLSPSPPPERHSSTVKHDARQVEAPSGGRTAHPDRTRNPSAGATRADEKKRSQRLFGALLGGLGPQRPAVSAASKRRAEQDERRRQETQKREAELGERQKHRLARLNLARIKEQRKLDEVNMRIRHSNMAATLNFLLTETEPKLYYKPWDLRPEDKERMERRRDDTEAQIDRELDDFAGIKRKWREEDNGAGRPTEQLMEEIPRDTDKVGHGGIKHTETQGSHSMDTVATKRTSIAPPDDETRVRDGVRIDTNDQYSQADIERQRKESIDDDAGDVVVEAEEDTVIY